MATGPLLELMQVHAQADQQFSVRSVGTELASFELVARKEAEISQRSRLHACLVEINRLVFILRFNRATASDASNCSDDVRGVHLSLHGVPGIPPEPLPEAVRDADSAISHLDAVLKALDAVLASPSQSPGFDGEITLAQFVKLSGIGMGTLEKNRPGKPAPIRKGSGRSPAVFSYQQFRRWVTTDGPRPRRSIPERYDLAVPLFSKAST